MEIHYIDTGRFTTIENLDDVATSGTPFNAINQGGGAIQLIPTSAIPFRQFVSNWNGPYLAFPGTRSLDPANGDYDEGSLLDIQGVQPIYFYTPLGLLEPKLLNLSDRYYGDGFSQYTIVSHGPNGVFDGNLTGAAPGDDIAVQIAGFNITIPAVSSARMSALTKSTGVRIVIRGYNFGATQGTGAVLLDGIASGGTIHVWTPTRIELLLPAAIAPGTAVRVQLNGGALAAREVPLRSGTPAPVSDWQAYE
jgi:hypothetical protein